MPRITNIQLRRDTAANWSAASANPTLAAGEIGIETDTGRFKIGTGSTVWNLLTYATDTSDFVGILSASNGGTGVNNIGTLSLPNANTLTLTTTSATNVTLPTSGILATTAAAAQLPFVSQAWYRTSCVAGTGISISSGVTYYTPFYVGTTTLFDALGVQATNIPQSTTVRVGIYYDGGGYPTTLLLDAGTISIISGGTTTYSKAITQTLTPGWYWLAFNQSGVTSTWQGVAASQNTSGTQRLFTQSAINNFAGYTQSGVTGAFANTTLGLLTSASGGLPYVQIKAA